MPVDQTPLDSAELIAPCGLNCRVCRAFVRHRKPCPGCRGGAFNKSNGCLSCAIKTCRKLTDGDRRFCFSCPDYPCTNLLRLEKRYRKKYGVNIFDNFRSIKEEGLETFLSREDAKWQCPTCGSTLCMHKPECDTCGHAWRAA